MSGRLLVVGSVNHDLVVAVERLPAPGETVLGAELEEHPGGKGANAATAAARLGAAASMVGAVGTDRRGDGALAALTDAGVDVALVQRRGDAPTGVAVVAVDGAGENQIVVAPGANAGVTAAQVERALEERAGAIDAVLVSCEVPDEAVGAAVRGAHVRGLRCVLNPAPARASLLDLVRWSPLLTPNRAEAAQLAEEEDAEAAATALAARTGAPVVVTLGADGALLAEPGAARRFAAREVEVRDTTGAGDAFNGALGARLALGDALADAVAYAVAAAGCSVATPGARAPLDPAAVERALAQPAG